MAEEIIESPSRITIRKPHHNRWLILIAAFKLAQAALFVAIGVGALRLLHKDLGDMLFKLAVHMHFNPESRFVDFILDRASIVNDRLLRRFSVALFAYATLGSVEGIGLYLEKEIFEVIRRVTFVRSALLVVNFMVFFYLLKVVTDRAKRANGKAPPEAS